MLPRMKNEVCALYNINLEDPRPEHAQGLVEIPVGELVRTRAVFKTNDAFPAHRFSPDQWDWDMDAIENKANLVQRWKFYRYWPTSTAMLTKRSYSGALTRLRSTDIEDEYFRVDDDQLRNTFRGGIIRGGSSIGGQVQLPIVDPNAPQGENTKVTLEHNQKYTVDDMFCGAGGASRGVQQAGFQLRFACDFDEAACNTYHENFPRALLEQMNIFEFAKSVTSMVRSDVLHISPPCQVWSPAHTRPGQNDDANVAALFACTEILENRRPRLSTGEQTFGLLFDRNEEFFNALIGQYTALGYSFRWDILRFKEYSVPSTRRRLIWIASCPGEPLPSFPTPTHSDTDKDLAAPVTIRSVLASIAPGSQHYDRLHNVQDMLHKARSGGRFPMPSYDDRCQAGTITTSGSEWAHPSGRRDFTLRELARIQGFPQEHKFVGGTTQIRRQIGNAFPPVVVETLYRHLRNCLLREDNVVTSERARQQDIITLDSDDDIGVSSVSKSREFMIIDDSDDERPRGRRGSVRRRVRDVSSDECSDTTLADLIDEPAISSLFSRESSRTLSVESLPSLIEMEVDNEHNGKRMNM
ncbi:S-adenosyl-L-methionine-dependent methyltransferase [Xylaria bambusicola]|uniref:S-adenosyl-L-methionine-dependent methyltransferase n=1 Tax=Xylaria bambusicola TaxID=326684 RepID=UPI0020088416|nr:S-adenosyl-L-methionine-dependent methyltransferase [Xylaria bambusicola]KAI0522252.1 S-adenosyl-L-methionine-dependent methyltransferase [Xylaria bambusicola]